MEFPIKLPSPNKYEIKVVNLTPDYDKFSYIDTFAIDYLNEYTSKSYTFPYTAFLAATIEANEQVGGSVPNFTYIVKGLKVKNWNTGITDGAIIQSGA